MEKIQNYILTKIDEDFYAVPTGAAGEKFSGIIRMNETGKEIVQCALEGMTIDKIVDRLVETYEVDSATAEKGVQGVWNKLQDAGIL